MRIHWGRVDTLMKPSPFASSRALALAALLAWLAPRHVRAEDWISYKFQDYQEMGGRVAVQVHGAAFETSIGTAAKVKFEGIIDSIAGATPNGQPARAGSDQVPLAHMTERRKAWSG